MCNQSNASFYRKHCNEFEKRTGFDVAIGPCRWLMILLGNYPDPLIVDHGLLYHVRFLIGTSIMFLFCILSQTVALRTVWGNLDEVIEIMTTMDVPTMAALFKYLSMRYNGYILRPLILTMLNDWNSPKAKEELQLMWKNAEVSRFISIIIIALAEGTCFTAIIATVVAICFSKTDETLEANSTQALRQLFLRAEFFYDAQKTPQYEITWAFQCMASFLASSSFSSTDALFATLVLHLCSRLNTLKNNMKTLSLSLTDQWNGDSYNRILGRIIRDHIFLERYAASIEDAFNIMFLVQVIVCSMIICIQGYELVALTTKPGGLPLFEIIYMTYFILCFLFSLFVYCFVSELLRNECFEVGDAAYEIEWYNFPVTKAKPLILIMLRAQKPFQITAGKFVDFSLELYCSILKTSGGYLSMLLAVKDRME